MGDLVETLKRCEKWLDRYRAHASTVSEADTKAGLIEPIIDSLGWDIRDPEEVRREYRRVGTDNPVDYALLLLRTPRLFIEAKGIGGHLDDPRWANQTIAYATAAGVAWVALTNGAQWRIYNAHAPVPIEKKLFRSVDLDRDPDEAVSVLHLLGKENMGENLLEELWKGYFVDRQVRDVLIELFSGGEPAKELVGAVRHRAPSLTPSEIRASLTRARAAFEFPSLNEPRAVAHTSRSLRAPADEDPVSPGRKPSRTRGARDATEAEGSSSLDREAVEWFVRGRSMSGRSRRYTLAWAASQATKGIDGLERVPVARLREIVTGLGVEDPEAPGWEVTLPNGVVIGTMLGPLGRAQAESVRPVGSAEQSISLSDLIASGRLVVGATLETNYFRQRSTAEVLADGSVAYRGRTYGSLSAAGEAVKVAIRGHDLPDSALATDGWSFWRTLDSASGALVTLKELRRRAREAALS